MKVSVQNGRKWQTHQLLQNYDNEGKQTEKREINTGKGTRKETFERNNKTVPVNHHTKFEKKNI